MLLTTALLLNVIVAKASTPSPSYNASQPRWDWDPAFGPLDVDVSGGAYVNLSSGVDLWYATMGQPRSDDQVPVLILHGGAANSHAMYRQANYLAKTRHVILHDTRGEGRSPYKGFTSFHYDDMARDAIAVLDHLGIERVAVFGWSDGGITGLNLAMNYTERIDRVFAYGAQIHYNQTDFPGRNDPIINSKTGTLESNFENGGVTRAKDENEQQRKLSKRNEGGEEFWCESISPIPDRCEDMYAGVLDMWESEPTWSREALAKIKCPVWSASPDHDKYVLRSQSDAIAAWTPFAGQLVLPHTGHWGLLEDWKLFNFVLGYFLDVQFDGQVPYY